MCAGGLYTVGVQDGPMLSAASRPLVHDDDDQTRQRHRGTGAERRLLLPLLAGRRRAVLAVRVSDRVRHVGDDAGGRRLVAGRQRVLADHQDAGDDEDAGRQHSDRHQRAAAGAHRPEPTRQTAAVDSAAGGGVVGQDDRTGAGHDERAPIIRSATMSFSLIPDR